MTNDKIILIPKNYIAFQKREHTGVLSPSRKAERERERGEKDREREREREKYRESFLI